LFPSEFKARIFATKVNLRLEAATLVDGERVHVVVRRVALPELDGIALQSSAGWRFPGIWL
jgi:hypothetical protein